MHFSYFLVLEMLPNMVSVRRMMQHVSAFVLTADIMKQHGGNIVLSCAQALKMIGRGVASNPCVPFSSEVMTINDLSNRDLLCVAECTLLVVLHILLISS